MSRFNTRLVVTAFCLCICGAGPICGRDVFVTVGGGPDPENNQVSLEKNVEYFSKVIANNYPSPLDHRILFADGLASDPDIQFIDESVEPSPAMKWMCRIIGEGECSSLRYRSSQLTTEASPANKQRLNELMQELADGLGQGDRLVLYVTAHGGPAHLDEFNYDEAEAISDTSEHARDTSIVLWGNEELRASEFTDWLDRFSPDVEVLVVMVQCYSGGFAEIVFRESNRRFGLSERPRCGFFSQRHDRASAGCTPAIDEANYQEYSSFFWAALNSLTRSSNEAIQADYDKDGRVSMSEAHAYAMITCDTIDVPLKTSDVVLRKYSKLEVNAAKSDPPSLVTSVLGSLFGSSKSTGDNSNSTSLDQPIEELLALSSADQREVIVQITSILEVPQDVSLRQLQRQRKKLATRIDSKYSELSELSNSETTLIAEIRQSLNRANPEFRKHGFSTIITEWTSTRSDEFVQLIESFEESKSLVHVQSQIESLTNLIDELECREAKLERLILVVQNVLLQANLPEAADEATVEQVRKLLELENSALW